MGLANISVALGLVAVANFLKAFYWNSRHNGSIITKLALERAYILSILTVKHGFLGASCWVECNEDVAEAPGSDNCSSSHP